MMTTKALSAARGGAAPAGETEQGRETGHGRETEPGRETRHGRETEPGRETRHGRETEPGRETGRTRETGQADEAALAEDSIHLEETTQVEKAAGPAGPDRSGDGSRAGPPGAARLPRELVLRALI